MTLLPSSTDVGWWENRVQGLRSKAADLESEVAQQEAELHRLRNAIRTDSELCMSWQAQVRADADEEAGAQEKMESQVAAMSRACHKNAELDVERRSLLNSISDANWSLGRKAKSACEAADDGKAKAKSRGGVVGRAHELRSSMKELGDRQAELVAEQEDERSKRRQLREEVRLRLEEKASCESELESRLAGRDAEMASLRERLEASEAAERRALEDSARFLQDAERQEQDVAPRKARERQEIRQQIQDAAAVHHALQADLQMAKERLWRKEQRFHEMGGRPWAAWVETAGGS